MPSGDFMAGLSDIGPLLVVAIPLGIYNFTEGMNNVESASAAGDNYNLRKVLLADGIGAIVGAVLGCPFPPAVYIGHPGWKAVGGRDRLFAGDRRRHRAGLLPRPDRAAAGGGAAGRDPADPAVHRPGHRRAGVRDHAGPSRAGGHAGACCPTSRPGRRARSTARWPRPARRPTQVGLDKLGRQRRDLPRAGSCSAAAATLAGLMLGAIAAFIIDREFDRPRCTRSPARCWRSSASSTAPRCGSAIRRRSRSAIC